MVEFIKDSGVIISNKGKDIKSLVMDLFIREIMLKESLKVVADINGIMDKCMKVSGLMVLNMDQVSGEEPKVILILGSGVKEELMAMEYILGLMEIDMKASLKIV